MPAWQVAQGAGWTPESMRYGVRIPPTWRDLVNPRSPAIRINVRSVAYPNTAGVFVPAWSQDSTLRLRLRPRARDPVDQRIDHGPPAAIACQLVIDHCDHHVLHP